MSTAMMLLTISIIPSESQSTGDAPQYNVPAVRHRPLIQLLVCLALVTAIAAPSLYTGWHDIQLAIEANAAGDFAEASAAYADAARILPWRSDLWEPAGLAAFRAGDVQGAIRFLQLAGQRAPLSADASVSLGSALWDQGQASAAIAALTQGLQSHPDAPALLDRLISAYDQTGDYSNEQRTLERRLAGGNHAAANYRLGLLLMASNAAEAEIQLQRAADLDAVYTPAVTTLEAAIRVARTETNSADQLTVIGRGLALVGEWHLASKDFRKAVQLDPDNAEAWAWLGESQQHLAEDGRAALDNALRLGPDDEVVHALRSLYWRRQADYAAALAEQIQAVQLEPQSAAMQAALGDAYVATGDLVSALAAYQEATDLAPSDASIWRQLAAFSAENGVQVEAVGLPAALKASALAPHDAPTLDVLGWTYTQTGSLDAGKETLLQSIAAEPDYAPAHLHLAETCLRLGDFASASSELQKVVELDPNGAAGRAARQLLDQYFP